MSRRPAAPPERPVPRAVKSTTPLWPTAVAGALTATFVLLVALFFTTRLPNNPQVTRWDVLVNTPDLLLDLLPGGQGTPNSGWRFFPQRLDLVLSGAAIWLAAWSLGRLALRGVGLFSKLDRFERHLWGCAVGIGLWSLTTLGLGLAGLLHPWLFRLLIVASIVTEALLIYRRPDWTATHTPLQEKRYLAGSFLPLAVGLAIAPFLMAMLLGAMLPTTEFDAREYHLEGPKEYFQAGRIHFLPHNVYTSFPFGTEMLYLLGMVLRGDWFRGARVGQVVLMGFAPLTAAALFYAGRRWFSERVGWLAVLAWLTVPWTYRISTVFYTEGGLAAFLLLAFVAAIRASDAWRADPAASGNWFLLAGFLAGNGPACKYPGAIGVAIPMFALVAWTVLRRSPGAVSDPPPSPSPSWRNAIAAIGLFLAGGAFAFGPWLAKNLFETGNPFYPLMYSIFGGRDLDAAQHAKWQAGHPLPLGHFQGAGHFLQDQWLRFLDAFLWNDWQTPLALAAVPVATLLLVSRSFPAMRQADGSADSRSRTDGLFALLLLESFWLFEAWCLLSHRLDRFWVPALPIACWIAAITLDRLLGDDEGRSSIAGLVRKAAVWSLLAGITLYHLALISTGLCGNNAWLLSERVAEKQFRVSSIALLEDLPLPTGSRVLFVGEAAVFEAHFPYVYHTVFDRSIFEEWFKAEGAAPPAEAPLKPKEEILRILTEHEITHVAVNWSEILRYRPTYTYTDFVHPDRFDALVEMGVLRRLSVAATFREFAKLPDDQRREVERWAPGLVQTLGGKAVVPGVQVYEVVK